MKNTVLWSLVIMALAVMVSMVVVGLSDGMIRSWQVTPAPREESSSVSVPAPPKEYAFLMKLEDGWLNIYLYGEDHPVYVLDLVPGSIPEYDRGQLEQGIPIRDTDELIARVEDYLS